MNTIQKRADELKPGDAIPANAVYPRRLVLSVKESAIEHGNLCVRMYLTAGANIGDWTVLPDQTFVVEAPTLTPAQEHAEELAKAARRLVKVFDERKPVVMAEVTVAVETQRELLSKIDPPKAPTLEEALEALRLMCEAKDDQHDYENLKNAQKILDRARRAQVLP